MSKLFSEIRTGFKPTTLQIDFMKRFGYLGSGPSDSEALFTEAAVVEALKKAQLFAGLRPTGVVDNETEVVSLISGSRG